MDRNALSDLIGTLIRQTGDIPEPRRTTLNALGQFIRRSRGDGVTRPLMFICTHNSRRSQLAELWMRVASAYYDHSEIKSYSGGTEATAFNSRMVDALDRAGFDMVRQQEGSNPHYIGSLDGYGSSQSMFSKKYDDPFNPNDHFVAIMVCSEADQNCPIVSGADHRVSLPYLDPKASDGTAKEVEAYNAKVLEVGREMLYLASLIR